MNIRLNSNIAFLVGVSDEGKGQRSSGFSRSFPISSPSEETAFLVTQIFSSISHSNDNHQLAPQLLSLALP